MLALCPFIPELVASPTYLLQLNFVNARQLLVDAHQLIGLVSELRELRLQELIEGTNVIPPPILS